MLAGTPIDRTLWSALGEQGFLGASIAERFGGLGLSALDLALVAEELGRGACATPFLSSIGLAAEAIAIAGTAAQQQRWLPRLADGSVVAAFAYAEQEQDLWSDLPSATLARGRISGIKAPVADLLEARIAIVACQAGGQAMLALVELDQPGATRTSLRSIDPFRPIGELRLDDVVAEPLADCNLHRLLDRAAMLTAFEQVGGAAACLDMACAYCLERKVFGRALASFQAVKHKLADLYVAVELARSNAYYAAWAVDADAPERREAVAVARLSALDAYEQAARENVQLHGGLGYTWEADCHFHYRRERLLCATLGGRERWSDLLIDALMPQCQAA